MMRTRATPSPTIRTAGHLAPGADHTAPARQASDGRRAERLLAAIRTTLVVALSALVLTIGALAYLVSFEAIRAFAIQTAAFPSRLAWTAPLLVDSFATAVSVALNIGHAPNHLAARLFAALPPIALLGAVELLMSVARCGLHPTTAPPRPQPARSSAAARKTGDPTTNASATNDALPRPLRAPKAHSAGNGDRPRSSARARVRELVSRERRGGPRVTVTDVTAATGLKRRRAYELLHEARAE
jgi:hypothetical protein